MMIVIYKPNEVVASSFGYPSLHTIDLDNDNEVVLYLPLVIPPQGLIAMPSRPENQFSVYMEQDLEFTKLTIKITVNMSTTSSNYVGAIKYKNLFNISFWKLAK